MPGVKDTDCRPALNGALKKRTRRRIIKCCENCRSSKYKCSRNPHGCERCIELQLECIYLPLDDEGWEVIEKAKKEHRKIEKRVAKRAKIEKGLEWESEDSDIEPSPLIATDAAYEDDDDIEDTGVRIGRFNLTKRIGSDYRPKMIEELTQMLDKNDFQRSDYDRQEFESLPKPSWLDAATGPKVLDPDPDYIAPSLFSHTLNVNQPIHKISPSQNLADRIMGHYWERVHPVAPVVHRPSFQERYDLFWFKKDTPESTQALVYATLFAGVVSMDAETVRVELGGEREEWVKTLEKAAAISLSRAHVIRTEKPETIQAFVMYLIPMCRNIISRTLATLVASAIDLARGMGLNKDGTHYGYSSIEVQVHRVIWHQLCFLDVRVCEAQSPRARIRKDEFDTRFPLNVEDSDLEKLDLSSEGNVTWTSMTLSNARMECNEKIRELYAARQRPRQGNESESAYIKKMLEMIHDFQQYMEKKYHPMIDDGIPIQHYTRLIIKLHCRRMHGIVLHGYHMSTSRGRMPELLSRTVVHSGLETMEVAKEIETSDDLRPWRWYAGALQQHSFATLILIEVFGFPSLDYAKRAWESLDWIFQVPSNVPLVHKGRWVLEGAVGVMREYLKARKLRYPTFMDERLEIVPSSFGTPILDEAPVTSETPFSGLAISVTSDAQAKIKHEIIYKDEEHVYDGQESTIGDLHTSALSVKRERGSSEESKRVSNLPDASSEEVTDTTSSCQSFNTSDLADHRSGYFTRDQFSAHSSHLVSPVTKSVREESDGSPPRATPSGSAHGHMMYHAPQDMWKLNTPPPPPHYPEAAYGPPANGCSTTTYQYDYSSNSSSDSHHGSDRGPYGHFPDCPSPSSASSSFTPINRNGSTMSFPSSPKVPRTALC